MSQRICIIGGGSQGHVIAGLLANQGFEVSILTRQPQRWSKVLTIHTPDSTIHGNIFRVSNKAEDVIPDAKIVLLTVPGYAISQELLAISPYLEKDCYVGGIFCSSGFFFEALKILPEHIKLWGFQRVPFIARVIAYGKEAKITGYKPQFHIAIERASENDKKNFAKWIETTLGSPVTLLKNYWEASITNSNPILHTARLYTMFSDWNPGQTSPINIPFYEDWTLEAAQMLIDMDSELFKILEYLPVSPGFLKPLLEYYESYDAESLKNKISSIPAFKGILSPMKQTNGNWVPDFTSRYFTEDFGYSLRYIWELGHKFGINIPNIDKVYNWGTQVTSAL